MTPRPPIREGLDGIPSVVQYMRYGSADMTIKVRYFDGSAEVVPIEALFDPVAVSLDAHTLTDGEYEEARTALTFRWFRRALRGDPPAINWPFTRGLKRVK